jgi:drug/metabolite transporter (DMT)-like permease
MTMAKIARSPEAAYTVAVVAAVWIGGFTLWTGALLLANAYLEFVADLPSETALTIALSRNYVPFAFAAVCTGLLAYLLATRRAHILSASVVILTVTLLCLAFGWFTLVTPMVKCQNFWPEWPPQSAQTPGESRLATAPGGPTDGGC